MDDDIDDEIIDKIESDEDEENSDEGEYEEDDDDDDDDDDEEEENLVRTLMSDNYSEDSDKETIQIKEDIQRSRATIDGLKLELNMWQKAYKDTQTKHAERIQKLMGEYSKREKELEQKFEQEKLEIVEEAKGKIDEFRKEHDELNLIFTTEHGNLEGIIRKLSEEKWSRGFNQYGSKLLFFLKSLEGLQISNDLKEKEILSLRDSQYMKSQEIEKVESELIDQLKDKETEIEELKRENKNCMITINEVQTNLKKQKDQCLQFEKKTIEQEENVFKYLHQITRLEKEKAERDKSENEHHDSLRKKERRIQNLEKKTRTLSVEIRKQLEGKDRKIDFLNNTLEKISAEKGKLEQVVLNIRTQLNRERQRTLEKGKIQKKEVELIQKDKKDLVFHREKMNQKIRTLEGKVEHFRNLCNQSDKMIELQGKKIKKFQGENSRFLKSTEKIERTMEVEKRAFRKREEDLEMKIREYQKRIRNLENKEKNELSKKAEYLKKQIEESKEYEEQLKQTAEKKLQMYERRIDRLIKERERSDSENRKEIEKMRKENQNIKDIFTKEKEELLKNNYSISSILEQQKLMNQSKKINVVEDMKQELLDEISNLRNENLTLRDKQLELSEKLLNQTKKELDESSEVYREEQQKQKRTFENRNNGDDDDVSIQGEKSNSSDSLNISHFEKLIDELTKERDFYRTKSDDQEKRGGKVYDRLKDEFETIERKYKIVKDKYFRQSIRQNELQNCLLRMSRFSNMLGTPNEKITKLVGDQISENEVIITPRRKIRGKKKKQKKKSGSKVVRRTLRIRKKKRDGGISKINVNKSRNDLRRRQSGGNRRSSRSIYSSQRGSRSVPPTYRKRNQESLY